MTMRLSRRARWIAVAAAVVLVVGALVTIVVLRSGGEQQAGAPPAPTTSAATPGAPASRTSPAQPGPSTPVSVSPVLPPPVSPPANGFTYQPLWPFTNADEAAAWQQSYRSGGHQPWHLDTALTAQSFTQGYLGFAGVDQVALTTVTGKQAWVGVGYRTPNGTMATAAVLHLVKLGPGTDAPWEVVGSRDTTLTLTRPAYGASVRSPVTVGGRITGVGENVLPRVFDVHSGLVGQAPGVAAGGQDAPWSVPVPFTVSRGAVLTVVAATGGHVAEVERFAVTGVVAG